MDKLNERRIELANIIVMEMDHQTVDQQGRLAIDLESGGQAMLFMKGSLNRLNGKIKMDF